MFLYKVKQILRNALLFRPRSLDNSKRLFTLQFSRQLLAGAQFDAFQRAVTISSIVLCRLRRRRRPHYVWSLVLEC